jgi:hypothetical protein
MVLDPLTALGLAGNIVQFVEFGCKAMCKARDINGSVNGSLPEVQDAEAVAQALIDLNSKIKDGVPYPSIASEQILQ